MLFKTNMPKQDYIDMLNEIGQAKGVYFDVKTKPSVVRIKRRGDRTSPVRGYFVGENPLKIRFFNTATIRIIILYILVATLMAIPQTNFNVSIQALLLMSVAVFVAIYLFNKFALNQTAHMLVKAFYLTPLFEKNKYVVLYNHFYFIALIIALLVYPFIELLVELFNVPTNIAAIAVPLFALVLIVGLGWTRQIKEVVVIERESVMRQNIFFKKDRLFYSSQAIEKISVVSKDVRGREKAASFCFEIKIKESELYSRDKKSFFFLKETDTIRIPFGIVTGQIIKDKLGVDFDETEYEEVNK